jgi:hypothetical protein
MACAIGETHDLVLDRGAIARTDALDDAGEKRRAIESAANDLVRALVRVRDPARKLPRMHCAVADETENRCRIVPRLHAERREVDRAAVEARRRSGLQAPDREAEMRRPRARPSKRAARAAAETTGPESCRRGTPTVSTTGTRRDLDAGLRHDAAHARAAEQQAFGVLL